MWSSQPYLKGISNRFPYPEKHFQGHVHVRSVFQVLRQKCHTLRTIIKVR